MATKEFDDKDINNIVMDVQTIDGKTYVECDCSSFKSDSAIFFWDEKTLVTIPIHQIKWVRMYVKYY